MWSHGFWGVTGGAKRKLVLDSSDSEATVFVPPVLITKKNWTKRTNKVKPTADHQDESQPGTIPDIPAGSNKSSTADMELVINEGTIVFRFGPEKQAQQSFTFAGTGIFALVEIREINKVTHFLPNIDPTAKGKGMLEAIALPNPVDEHCQLMLKPCGKMYRVKWLIMTNGSLMHYDTWYRFEFQGVPAVNLVAGGS
ncbi:hypothetical protein F511_24526 [Dorcoceras hygrometricum]|uniref:Uncharacterized protein n=1 Tax=Dorcoceras hygrometricum TaxID=472368 RepID=A0A2Z7B029_9LAMI|nr:hypothetical protein F511_24526 [Dorcoceras hygrometricum]